MRFPSTIILCGLLAFVLYFSGLEAIGLVGPDEPRYADVARGMLRSGDYITPRLFGSPWFEKPPLYYWLAALFFRAEVNETTARLPSAIFATAFLGLWFWFAQRFFGLRTAAGACLLLASSLGWIGFARAAAMDMLLSTTLDAALVLLAFWFWEKKAPALYGFYFLLAVATLAKGPVAMGLAGLITLSYLATFQEWRALQRLLWSPGIALFAAVALPWYLLCYARNGPAFFEEFFIQHHWQRLTSAAALGHPQPFWFYVPIVAAGLFPWTPLLLLPVADLWRGGLRSVFANRQKALLFYWVALPFLFFSLSENKLPGYLLPILPPLTLWIALLVEGKGIQPASKEETGSVAQKSSPDPSGSTALRNLSLGLVGLSALFLLTAPVLVTLLPDSLATGFRQALSRWSPDQLWRQMGSGEVPWPIWLALAGLVVVSFYMLGRKRMLEAALAVMLGVALSTLTIVEYLAPSINRVASVRTLAHRIEYFGIPPEHLAVYRIHRNHALGLSFYLDHALPEWSPEQAPASVSFVVARQEERLDEKVPGARSLALYPGLDLRLWALPPP